MVKGKNHPILVLMRGLPGSGKSYIADRVVRRFEPGEVVILDPDRTDYTSTAYKDMCAQLKQEGVDEKFYPYRFLRAQAYAAIESGQIIIWTQAFTNLDGFQKTVANLTAYATDRGIDLPLLVVELEVDPAVARERIAERTREGGLQVPAERFDKFVSEYRSFEDEGYDTLKLDASADIDDKVKFVHDRIAALLSS